MGVWIKAKAERGDAEAAGVGEEWVECARLRLVLMNVVARFKMLLEGGSW